MHYLTILLFIPILVLGHDRAPPGINPQQYGGQHHGMNNQGNGQQHVSQQGGQQFGGPQAQVGQQYGLQGQDGAPHQVREKQYGAPQGQGLNSHHQPQGQIPNAKAQDQPKQYQSVDGSQHQAASQPVQPEQRHHGNGQDRVLHRDMEHEKEHMKEHMDVPMDTSNMSEQELQFHYFRMHDSDNNNKLDGCELVKSVIHWHADQAHHQPSNARHQSGLKIFQDEELAVMIDPILVSDDRNRDGFIDYYEFVAAQNAQVKAYT